MTTYSIKRAADLIGINPQTLYRWVWAGRVRPSIVVPLAEDRNLARFTPKDIKDLRRYKAAHYGEGRGGPGKKRKPRRTQRRKRT